MQTDTMIHGQQVIFFIISIESLVIANYLKFCTIRE